jgi:hypothetical protein
MVPAPPCWQVASLRSRPAPLRRSHCRHRAATRLCSPGWDRCWPSSQRRQRCSPQGREAVGSPSPGRYHRAKTRCRCLDQVFLRVLDELLPSAYHVMEQYGNNPIESDHGRLKSRLRPMRGLKRLRSARVISAGHAFVQTSAAATTNSAWNSTHSSGSRRPSPNSPSPSDRGTTPISRTRSPSTQQSRTPSRTTRPAGTAGYAPPPEEAPDEASGSGPLGAQVIEEIVKVDERNSRLRRSPL